MIRFFKSASWLPKFSPLSLMAHWDDDSQTPSSPRPVMLSQPYISISIQNSPSWPSRLVKIISLLLVSFRGACRFFHFFTAFASSPSNFFSSSPPWPPHDFSNIPFLARHIKLVPVHEAAIKERLGFSRKLYSRATIFPYRQGRRNFNIHTTGALFIGCY